jgi:hypothetical protein
MSVVAVLSGMKVASGIAAGHFFGKEIVSDL